MEQRNQDFQERARRRELTDRELFSVTLKLREEDFTTAGDLLNLMNTNEGKNFNQLYGQTKSLRIGDT
jgi:flagellar basal body P-ring protein FlgI